MAEKNIKSRVVLKHDVESNWLLATGFTPLKGEVVIYDPDETYSYSRLKIGDGVQNVNDLPFVDDALRTELFAQIGTVDDKVDAVGTLVGDTAVATQISNAMDEAITDLSVSGTTITYTKGDGSTGTITTQDTNTTYSAAGSSLGLVKSGGDVTISDGVITVKDDSHNHTIASIDSLQTTLDGKANKSQGVFYIEGTGTTDDTNAVATWVGSHSDITSYYNGLIVAYKIAAVASTSTTLNINNLGAVKVVRNDNIGISTAYPVNSVVLLIYTTDSSGTSYWKVADYDSNSKTTAGSSNKDSTKMYLVGATSQSTSGQTTYSNKNVYIGTDNCLYSNDEKVATSDEVTAVSTLVGDIAVSTQIETAMAEKADIDHLHDVVYLNSKSAQLPSSHDWSAITYGDGTYVAVASGYNNKAAYSTDGVTWTQTTLPSYESWVDVAYGDGVFVAIAGDSSSVAAYSTDGITWTQRLMPNALNWTAVTYGNGMFLAVAHSSTIGALGFGGSSWQSTYLPDSLGWSDVTFDGSQYIVVTDDGNTIARSSDGFSWSTSSYSAMSEGITAVAAAQGQSKYVGLGTSMSEIFYYSTNGSYWTHAYVTSGDWRDVVYGNDKFVAVAYGTNMASYSVDGSSWTNVTLPITANWTGITYGDGMFVAVAEGSTICAFSYDGITWMLSKTNLLDKNGNDVSNQIAALVNTINAPKTTTVTLSASGWSGSSNPWSQVVNINGVTANSKVDLQPTASQIVELQNADIMLMVENNAGVTTAYAIGGKPTSTYTMQALITEVIPV